MESSVSLVLFIERDSRKSYLYSNAFDCSLQVHVDKGMNDGQKITFRGEGDQEVRDQQCGK